MALRGVHQPAVRDEPARIRNKPVELDRVIYDSGAWRYLVGGYSDDAVLRLQIAGPQP